MILDSVPSLYLAITILIFGARSLAQAVKDDVAIPLAQLWLDSDEGIGRGPRADVALEKYSVHIDHADDSDEADILLCKDGETKLRSGDLKVKVPLFTAEQS